MKKSYKKLSYEEIEHILANAKASLAVEGLQVTTEETETVRKYFNGIYTEKEVLEIIRKG